MEYDKVKYKAYLKSNEWVQLKIDLIQDRGCKCERCNRSRKPTSLQVHHITYKRLYNELASDLELLCRGCHMKEHGIKKDKKKKVKKKTGSKRAEYQYIVRDGQGNWRVQVNGWKHGKKFKKRKAAAKLADIILIKSGKNPVNVISPQNKSKYYSYPISY